MNALLVDLFQSTVRVILYYIILNRIYFRPNLIQIINHLKIDPQNLPIFLTFWMEKFQIPSQFMPLHSIPLSVTGL